MPGGLPSRGDAASRVMAAQTDDGRQITEDELLLELHHMVIAGYIVFALLAELVSQLHQVPGAAGDYQVPAGCGVWMSLSYSTIPPEHADGCCGWW